jgi:hypothetical protein
MTRTIWLTMGLVLVGCGGGRTSNVEARCSLSGETYDASFEADGARCGGEGFGYCLAGDRCVEDGVCELVLTPPEDGYCALLDRPYDAFYDADGARCGGEGFGYCFLGDRCVEAGVCAAVLSAAKGAPHAELLGASYDAFYDATGPRCGGEGFGYCFAGDHCVEPGICELVLTGLGGTLRSDLIGSTYDAFFEAEGPRCGGEGFGSCHPGDRCVSPGACEVVLSAWTP